jgi:putative ABC transport system permease protein
MTRIASIRPGDLTQLAWSSLRKNGLRSSLTIGAIAVGIAVMMYLVSLGLGLEQLTIGQVEASSALHSLDVSTANADLLPLTPATLGQISGIPNVQSILPQLTVDGQISLADKVAQVTVLGEDPGYLKLDSATQLTSGRYFRDDDTDTMVVTTGFLKAFSLDPTRTPLITFNLTLDPVTFPHVAPLQGVTVAGVVTADQAISVYLPLPYLRSLVGSAQPDYTGAKLTVANLDEVPAVADRVRALGFRVDTVTDTVSQIKQVFRYVQVTLAVLGAIAIGVASIGMFNTLTISLLERTKEIGIMKALGVRKADIRRLFLAEATLMGIIGGFAGIGLAVVLQQLTIFIFSLLAQYLDGTVPQLFVNNPEMLLGFLLFAICIALVTGIYPAQRATKLNAIEAIRFE